jgi:hypothetical protein
MPERLLPPSGTQLGKGSAQKEEPMKKLARAFVVFAAVTLVVGAIPVAAQDQAREPAPPSSQAPPPSQTPPAQAQANVAQGQLLRVDSNAKVIEIRSSESSQMQFKYNDQTKVTGADKGVAGLATMSGSTVRVHFTKQGQDNIATEIEVEAAKK